MLAYLSAWDSNDPGDITALFTDDAEYYTLPGRPAKAGIDAILAWWDDARDEPGDYTFRWEPVTVTPNRAVIQGYTDYRDREGYHNLWIIDFEPDGRASRFTEWWVEVPADGSGPKGATLPVTDAADDADSDVQGMAGIA